MKLSRSEILDKLKETMLSVDSTQKEKIQNSDENTRLVEDIGLSSVGIIYLVLLLEASFQIKFENVTTTTFKTVGQVIDYIEEKM